MEIRRINNGKIFYFGNDVIPKYSFNAKELDEETGMYYFEARYYRAPTFISRDPLMNEKPWLTPYHYCSNNPVGRIDPTGMSDEEPPPTKIPYRIENSEQKNPFSQSTNNNTNTSTTATTKTQETKSIGEKIISTLEKIDNACEGSADPGNRGTITKQDVKVGFGVLGIVSGGLVLATGSIASGTAAILLGINDAGSNSNAESILQQNISNPTAKTMVGHGEIITSFAFGGWGIKTVLRNPQKIEEGISGAVGVTTGIFGTAQQTNQETEKNKSK